MFTPSDNNFSGDTLFKDAEFAAKNDDYWWVTSLFQRDFVQSYRLTKLVNKVVLLYWEILGFLSRAGMDKYSSLS
jgi:hypothetical protein